MSTPTGRRLRALSAGLRDRAACTVLLSVVDSRRYVRTVFLASAARLDALPRLVEPRTAAALARELGVSRTDRVEAWLEVGASVGELQRDEAARYRVRGRRARALAAGHSLLVAHYRSMLDYQAGPYAEAAERFRDPVGRGRVDLDGHAGVIAEVSRAAEPFIRPYLEQEVRRCSPRSILDVGCGTGTALETMLLAAPDAVGHGIDVAPAVAAAADARLRGSAAGGRARVWAGDVRTALATSTARYDLITLLNNVYYFDRDARPALYRDIRRALAPDGVIIVVTMEAPGSVASAHLDLMLRSQDVPASLPRVGEVARDVREAGFGRLDVERLVPGEPFVAVRATAAT